MEKLIYALWKDSGEENDGFARRMREEAMPALLEKDFHALQLNVVDGAVSSASSLVQSNCLPSPVAFASMWMDSARQRPSAEEVLKKHAPRIAGYLVTESMPIVNTEHPPQLGERTWGFAQVVMLQRPPRLSREDWLKVWLESHTQVAIDTQATFLYVQNIVMRHLTYGAPHIDAFVEEGFPKSAMTSQEAFYDAEGNKAKYKKNLKAMIDSCVRFLDFDRIDVIPTSQYVFKST